MPRTTIDLDASVIAQLREWARREGKSMGRVASEHLAQTLGDDPAPRSLPPLRLNTRPLGAPLVDLEDKDALWSALERDEA